jgi:MFS family permease
MALADFAPPPPGAKLSDTLWNRTYLGLLLAQFLAAFNDQAIHASAMFFAIRTGALTEAQAISLMPILFYAPWALFCTLSGYLADRYSKQRTLILWKAAEVAICALALYGFWLGTEGGQGQTGAWIVLSTVFLMGTHSAFFVPAKYGVMPEILAPQLLSRGNGVLESLSFLAVILGTVTGGVLSYLYQRQEAIIGMILLGLAVLGAIGSLLIHRMPAANAQRPFPRYIYGPLINNIRTLFSTRPLRFACVGLAFFTFIVAFMRATVYMLGESQNPRWDELKTSLVVGTVALGVGLGSPLAGWLSGKKVELGLIPLGGLGMIIGCFSAGYFSSSVPGLIASTVLIGFSTGFFLVPLFTLLQYRAPKSSKGEMIATSNFINVVGAIASSLLFAVIVLTAKKTGIVPVAPAQDAIATGRLSHITLDHGRPVGFTLETGYQGGLETVSEAPFQLFQHVFGERPSTVAIDVERGVEIGDTVTVSRFTAGGVEHQSVRRQEAALTPHYNQENLPKYLFAGAGLLTFIVLVVLTRIVPNLPKRAWYLLTAPLRGRVDYEGLENVPGAGPVLFRVVAPDRRLLVALSAAVDRWVVAGDGAPPRALLALRQGHMVRITEIDTADGYHGALAEEIAVVQLRVSGENRAGRYVMVVTALANPAQASL